MLSKSFEFGQLQEPATKGGFLRTADLDALPFLDRLNVGGSLVEAVTGPGVEPGKPAAKPVHAQTTALEVFDIHIGYLQFAARGRFEVLCDRDDLVVENVEAGNGIVASGLFRLLFDGNGL